MDYPPGFPDRFRPIVEAAILRAEHKSKGTGVQQLIKAKLFEFAEVACSAAEAKAWQPDSALTGLHAFIDALCEADSELIDSEMERRLSRTSQFAFSTEPARPEVARQTRFERFKRDITREIRISREWLGYMERLERLAKPAEAKVVEKRKAVATETITTQLKTESEDEIRDRRAKLLAEYKATTSNPSNKRIYEARNSGIHKPEFYEWCKGTLSDDSATTTNFERFLREKKPPIPRNPRD